MMNLYKKIRQWFKYIVALGLHYSGLNSRIINRSGQYIVLTFHKIDDNNDMLHLSVLSETLAQVVKWCKSFGEITSLDDAIKLSSGKTKFCITFDDGYKDNIKIPDVIPNIPVIVYIATGFIDSKRGFWAQQLQESIINTDVKKLDLTTLGLGKIDVGDEPKRIELIEKINREIKNFSSVMINSIVNDISIQCGSCHLEENGFMSWDDVSALSQSGVHIGGHTHDHFISSKISSHEFRQQLNISSDHIKNHLGYRALHFAYPNGGKDDISKTAPAILKEAGYQSAVTTVEGINTASTNHYKIKRFNMDDTRLRAPSGKLSIALFTTLIANRLFYN